MAAIENLDIVVSVDISRAIEDLQDLQDELEDVADEISKLRAEGASGIGITTNVESIKDDLAQVKEDIEAFEAGTTLNIDTDVDRAVSDMAARSAGGGGGVPSFNAPFLAEGTRAAARMDDISGGMGMIFGDQRGGDAGGGLRGALKKLGDTLKDARKSISEFDLRMSDIHNMLARIVPLLFVFIGAIPAAVTAILGLAAAAVSAGAALLAFAGFGALGFGMAGGEFDMDRLSDAFSDLRNDFLDTFAPLANELQPLFKDTLSGLEDFFDAVANQGDALLALEDEARAFGGFLMAFIPNLLRTMAALVEGMSDVFGGIGGFLRNNLTSAVETLLELTVEIMPVLAQLAQTIGGMLPALAELSAGFIQVLNVLFVIIGAFFRLMGALGISARGFGIVVAAALTAATAILLARTAVLSLVFEGLATLAGAVYSMVVPATATIVSAFTSSAIATYVLTAAIASLITLLTLGAGLALIGLATSAAAKFTSLAGSIGDATDSLKDFRSVQSGMGDDFGGMGDNPYGFDPKGNGGGRGPRGSNGGTTVFNVESSGDPEEDRSNLEHADWLAGRTTQG